MVSYKRQGGGGLFDFRKNDMAMDVSWCTLIPLLSPTKEIMKILKGIYQCKKCQISGK